MDIIFEMDYLNNRFSGYYYGINDKPFMASKVEETPFISTFVICFYFWGVHLFADSPLNESLNISVNADDYFYGWNSFFGFFESMMLRTSTIKERIPIAEEFLLSKLNLDKSSTSILNAAYGIVNSQGTSTVEVCMSVTRQSISRWESEQSYPEMDKIVYLAEILGVSLDYLLKDNVSDNDEKKEKGGAVTRLLYGLKGKKVIPSFYSDGGDYAPANSTCTIIDYDGQWVNIEYTKGKKTEAKFIPVSSILSIKYIKEGK